MKANLAIVGAGIVGLAHALAAARAGARVTVIDRERAASGASVRNFGFITVTGQERGESWRLAMRTRNIWAEVAPLAGIEIVQKGLIVAARRTEAAPVLEAFLATEMGAGLELLGAERLRARYGDLFAGDVRLALVSPHDLRVESRTAIPRLRAFLAERLGVRFLTAHAREVRGGRLDTSAGEVLFDALVIAPGDEFHALFPERIGAYGLARCRLQMMRLEPPGPTLPAPVMSDLSLIRYAGYAALPEAAALKARLAEGATAEIAAGIHLIVTQSADGSLVVGDSHHTEDPPSPFATEAVDRMILNELEAVFGRSAPPVRERWQGTYALSHERRFLVDQPSDNIRIVIVTGGTGASTAFAIAEDVIKGLLPRGAGT